MHSGASRTCDFLSYAFKFPGSPTFALPPRLPFPIRRRSRIALHDDYLSENREAGFDRTLERQQILCGDQARGQQIAMLGVWRNPHVGQEGHVGCGGSG